MSTQAPAEKLPEWKRMSYRHYAEPYMREIRVREAIDDLGPWTVATFDTLDEAEAWIAGWRLAFEQGFHDGYECGLSDTSSEREGERDAIREAIRFAEEHGYSRWLEAQDDWNRAERLIGQQHPADSR